MRILITSLGARSHLKPTFPMAADARREGHQVLFATGSDGLDLVKSAGFTATSAGLRYSDALRRYLKQYPQNMSADISPAEQFLRLLVDGLIGIAAEPMIRDLIPLIAEWKPDVMISTIAEVGGQVAAARVRVPHVTHSFGPPKSRDDIEPLLVAREELYARWEVAPSDDELYAQEPYLDIWPARMASGIENWLYPNAWPMRPDETMPHSPRPPKPAVLEGLPYQKTVYVTLGTTWNATMSSVLPILIEAVRDKGVNVVATTGPDVDPALAGPQPDHVRVERFIPQHLLLPYCDAVVCHAGAATVLGALGHGLPLVCAPVASDQHEIAAGAQDCGAALACDGRSPSVEEIADAFERVIADSGFREAASLIARDIAAMPPPAEAVASLATYVKATQEG
jgi:UDP:flavonoid glycosyltransferase YjiC (YdhE family)